MQAHTCKYGNVAELIKEIFSSGALGYSCHTEICDIVLNAFVLITFLA